MGAGAGTGAGTTGGSGIGGSGIGGAGVGGSSTGCGVALGSGAVVGTLC
jgi:hypothetical protein